MIHSSIFSTRHAVPFEAFFAPSSDAEFSVTPATGELMPAGTEGTLLKVGYTPQLYGKTHRATLVVQVGEVTHIRNPGFDSRAPRGFRRISSPYKNQHF